MKDWIKSSFRNRIFVTVLLVTLLPMLLCDIFIMQIAMSQSRRQLREQALEELQQTDEAACEKFAGVIAKWLRDRGDKLA